MSTATPKGIVHVARQRALSRAHRACDDARHPRVALELGDVVGLARADLDLGHEPRDRRQGHARLAERRQHLLDVAEEQRVRPDDEHALALEREAVRVEQVRRAVQRDGGLPRAGPALDHQEARQRRADDLVLLALDRGHDVAHLARPRLAERGEEGAGAPEGEAVLHEAVLGRALDLRAVRAGAVGLGEVLVFDAEHLAVPDLEVASAREPERLDARRAVEGLGDRCAPVDDERLEVLAGHGDASDVERLARRAVGRRRGVDATEAQRLVADVELLEA